MGGGGPGGHAGGGSEGVSSSRRTRHAHALCFLLLTPMLVPRAAAVAAEGTASTGCLPYSRSIAQVTVVSPARHNGAARRAAQAASCTLTVSSRWPSWTLWPPPNISSPRRHDAAGPPPPGVGCQLEAAVRCKSPSVLPRPWRRGRAAAGPGWQGLRGAGKVACRRRKRRTRWLTTVVAQCAAQLAARQRPQSLAGSPALAPTSRAGPHASASPSPTPAPFSHPLLAAIRHNIRPGPEICPEKTKNTACN